MALRVAFLGIGHWHLPIYLEPVLGLDDVTVAGVSDPEPGRAREVADRLSCASSADFADLCERTRPDFVFALGRHCDMADEARYLIDEGIPFAMEKPCGVSYAEVRALADLANSKGAFAAVPFVLPGSDLERQIQSRNPDQTFEYLSFKMIGRPVERYIQERSPWMLDRHQAGGGALINLGIHFIDWFRRLAGGDVRVTGAVLGNQVWHQTIEDYVAVTLRGPSALGMVETGYINPSTNAYMDLHYSIRSRNRYFVVTSPRELEISGEDLETEKVTVGTTNASYYPVFIRNVLDRVQHDQLPSTDMEDAALAMELVEAAYELGGLASLASRAPG